MFLKHQITMGQENIWMKLNTVNDSFTLGGFARTKDQMESMLMAFFGFTADEMPPLRFSQANKIRFEFNLHLKDHRKIILELKNSGIDVQQVKKIGKGF